MLQLGRQSEDGCGLKGPSSKSKATLVTHAGSGSCKNSTVPSGTNRQVVVLIDDRREENENKYAFHSSEKSNKVSLICY